MEEMNTRSGRCGNIESKMFIKKKNHNQTGTVRRGGLQRSVDLQLFDLDGVTPYGKL